MEQRLAINSRGSVDPRWYTHNRRIERALELCSIQIYENLASDSEYDPVTNTWSSTKSVLWEGFARIQPKSASAPSNTSTATARNIDPAERSVVDIHIGLNENLLSGSDGSLPDVRPGSRIKVTSSPIDENMLNFEYVIRSVMNSSNPWHRVLVCEVNEEMNHSA